MKLLSLLSIPIMLLAVAIIKYTEEGFGINTIVAGVCGVILIPVMVWTYYKHEPNEESEPWRPDDGREGPFGHM